MLFQSAKALHKACLILGLVLVALGGVRLAVPVQPLPPTAVTIPDAVKLPHQPYTI